LGKTLVVAGLVLASLGVMLLAGVPLGRLPGDFVIRRGGMTIYVPVGTSVVVSVLLSAGLAWWRR